MKGTVKVLKKGAKVPTAAQDKAAVKKQAADAVKDAKTLAGKTQPANTVALGVDRQERQRDAGDGRRPTSPWPAARP